MSFRADVDTEAYMRAMRRLGNDILPEIIAETLNETADAVTKRSLRYLNSRLTVRTKFTTNSINRPAARPYKALNKAKGHNLQRMFSRAGTISPYLSVQDQGATIRAKGDRVPIPTLNARTGKNLSRSIAGRYNLGRMGDIAGDGRYFIGEPKGGNRPLGLYERTNKNHKLRMLRNLESRVVNVPKTSWHTDASEELGSPRFIRARFRRNAERRLKRLSRRAG